MKKDRPGFSFHIRDVFYCRIKKYFIENTNLKTFDVEFKKYLSMNIAFAYPCVVEKVLFWRQTFEIDFDRFKYFDVP